MWVATEMIATGNHFVVDVIGAWIASRPERPHAFIVSSQAGADRGEA
jgi:hypothetical protein